MKPYTFNPQPFLADKRIAMQGYVTSEPYRDREPAASSSRRSSCSPTTGFDTYSTLIETRRDLVEKKPDLVQRFVDASIIGWYNYLYGDNKAANALIKKHNPEMTDALLAYSVAKMKEYGIVDSGDALTLGIGAMTDARMKSFFDKMVRAGVVKPALDYKQVLHAAIREQERGLDLRPKHVTSAAHRHDAVASLRLSRSSRCTASARPSPTASSRSTTSISTCARANSSRCSGRRAAASRPRCASSRA